MTTLRDLLNDFMTEILDGSHQFDGYKFDEQEYEEWKEQKLDEYIDAIKERWVG